MREYITLECGDCKRRNYRTEKNTSGPGKMKLQKYCKWCRKHTTHTEHRR